MILIKGLWRYQRSKLEFKKSICQSFRFEPMRLGSAKLADIFFNFQLWPLISLQPLNQNHYLVLYLKDLIHICLKIKAQGFWMTFKACNLGPNYPYLLHKMSFVDSQTQNTVKTPNIYKIFNILYLLDLV